MNEKRNVVSSEKHRLADYSTIGIMFPASIAVGLAVGYFLDKLLDTEPYLLITFLLYGVAAGFVNLIKVTKKYDGSKSSKKPKQPEPGQRPDDPADS